MKADTFTPIALAEAVGRLRSMPAFLASALASVPAADLARQCVPGEFSLVEHACHLRDLEREGYLVRVNRMLTEQEPALEPFDGGAVAAARDYPGEDAFAAAREFSLARAEAVSLIGALSPATLAREGTFGDRRVCFADVIAMMVEHDRGHREEIERLLVQIGS
jgi:DinB superfamily